MELKVKSWKDLDNNELLTKLQGKSGVYFISPEIPENPVDKILVKIGIGESRAFNPKRGLSSRLDSYLLCYPRGFNIFGLVVTKKKEAVKLERKIHSYLAGKGRKFDLKHSHIEEWYWLSLEDIEKTIQLHQETPNVLDSVVFTPPHFLQMNPTAGKQRKVISSTSPERRSIESDKPALSPPLTELKKLRSQQRATNATQSQPPTKRRLVVLDENEM